MGVKGVFLFIFLASILLLIGYLALSFSLPTPTFEDAVNNSVSLSPSLEGEIACPDGYYETDVEGRCCSEPNMTVSDDNLCS